MPWKNCSACKTPIEYNAQYWVCSVSTCNRARNPYVFCKLGCWDSHVPVMNHRDAWAEERTAPSQSSQMANEGRRRVARPAGSAPKKSNAEREILIVVSRLKKYIKDQHGLSTSEDVADILSDHVRALCDEAAQTAAERGRKTLMARDVRGA